MNLLYRCIIRLVSLVITCNTGIASCSCEAAQQMLRPQRQTEIAGALATAAAATASAATVAVQKWQERKATNTERTNKSGDVNPNQNLNMDNISLASHSSNAATIRDLGALGTSTVSCVSGTLIGDSVNIMANAPSNIATAGINALKSAPEVVGNAAATVVTAPIRYTGKGFGMAWRRLTSPIKTTQAALRTTLDIASAVANSPIKFISSALNATRETLNIVDTISNTPLENAWQTAEGETWHLSLTKVKGNHGEPGERGQPEVQTTQILQNSSVPTIRELASSGSWAFAKSALDIAKSTPSTMLRTTCNLATMPVRIPLNVAGSTIRTVWGMTTKPIETLEAALINTLHIAGAPVRLIDATLKAAREVSSTAHDLPNRPLSTSFKLDGTEYYLSLTKENSNQSTVTSMTNEFLNEQEVRERASRPRTPGSEGDSADESSSSTESGSEQMEEAWCGQNTGTDPQVSPTQNSIGTGEGVGTDKKTDTLTSPTSEHRQLAEESSRPQEDSQETRKPGTYFSEEHSTADSFSRESSMSDEFLSCKSSTSEAPTSDRFANTKSAPDTQLDRKSVSEKLEAPLSLGSTSQPNDPLTQQNLRKLPVSHPDQLVNEFLGHSRSEENNKPKFPTPVKPGGPPSVPCGTEAPTSEHSGGPSSVPGGTEVPIHPPEGNSWWVPSSTTIANVAALGTVFVDMLPISNGKDSVNQNNNREPVKPELPKGSAPEPAADIVTTTMGSGILHEPAIPNIPRGEAPAAVDDIKTELKDSYNLKDAVKDIPVSSITLPADVSPTSHPSATSPGDDVVSPPLPDALETSTKGVDSSNSTAGGNGGADLAEPDNVRPIKTFHGNTKHFLHQILGFHNYAAHLVHQSINDRLILQAAAAGDEIKVVKGLWIKAILGNTTERKGNSTPGYNGQFHGFTIGIDAEFDDDLLVGAAFSSISSRAKFKDMYSDHKTNSETKISSLYGRKDISNNVFISGTASLTQSDNKSNYLKTDSQGKEFFTYQEQNIQGGYIDFRLNYIEKFKNGMVLIPFVGVNYSKNTIPGFSETDTTGTPFAVASLRNERTSLMIGGTLSLPTYFVNRLEMTPKINVAIDQQLHGRTGSIRVTEYDGAGVEEKLNGSHKTSLSLGGSLEIAYKNTDFLITYDTRIRRKFFGQQIAIKIRWNF